MSTLTNEVGRPGLYQSLGNITGNAPAVFTSGLMDATGEKVAFVGSVWHPTVKTGTINIRKVHWLAGAISSFNASSNFRVSIQSVSATAGPPFQPDGTIRGTGAAGYYDYGAGVSPTASAWNTTGAFGADVPVNLANDSLGDADSRFVAVVFEYSAFTSTTSVIVGGATYSSTVDLRQGMNGMLLLTASWAVQTAGSIVVLECDDGTFAFLDNALTFSAFGTASVSSSAAIRRAGLKFRVPTERKIDRMELLAVIPNVCDGRVVLYDSDGTTELASIDVDNDAVASASGLRTIGGTFAPVTLAANTYYRIVFVGGTTTAATIYYGDVNAAGHMDGLVGGQDMHWTQHDGTSWADTTTRRPHFVLGFSAFHDGAGGGGGGGPLIGGRLAR